MELFYEKENTEAKEGQTLKIYRASNFARHKKLSKTNLFKPCPSSFLVPALASFSSSQLPPIQLPLSIPSPSIPGFPSCTVLLSFIMESFAHHTPCSSSSFSFRPCYRLHCVALKFISEALTPSVTVFGDRANEEVI